MLRFCGSPGSRSDSFVSFEQIAAAVAVGLYLEGVEVLSLEELAAALATAVHLSRARPRPKRRPEPPTTSGWAMTARMQHMGVRLVGRERALLRSVG